MGTIEFLHEFMTSDVAYRAFQEAVHEVFMELMSNTDGDEERVGDL